MFKQIPKSVKNYSKFVKTCINQYKMLKIDRNPSQICSKLIKINPKNGQNYPKLFKVSPKMVKVGLTKSKIYLNFFGINPY